MQILIAIKNKQQVEALLHLGRLVQQMTGGDLDLMMVVKKKEDRDRAEALLSQIKTELEAADIQTNTRVRVGKIVKEILRALKKGDYDLLIIGEPRHPGLVTHILTPKTKRILSEASCPVLIARGDPRHLQSLLVCESGRIPSLLNRLIDQVSPFLENITQLTVLHVMSQIPAHWRRIPTLCRQGKSSRVWAATFSRERRVERFE